MKNIAYCGLDCQKCPAYIATKTNDQELREKVAREWSLLNHVEITPEMINCDGCRENGRKTPFCDSLCPIRQCALKKDILACGSCGGLSSCGKIKMITEHSPEACEILKRNAKPCLKILFIGNSFSDDTIQWMPDIAEALGIQIKVENLYIGGCSLETHLENIQEEKPAYEWIHYEKGEWIRTPDAKMKDIIEGEDWDYVLFQQASHYSGKGETYRFLPELLQRVEGCLKDKNHSRFAWNMTWAYQKDSDHPNFPDYDRDQTKMYRSICSAVQSEVLPLNRFALILPIGTAIQNARTSSLGDTLTRDGFHLSYQLGRYIAGLTAIASLTGADIASCGFMAAGEKETEIAKESVKNALKNPFAITPFAL